MIGQTLPSRAELTKNAVELNRLIGGNQAALGVLLADEPTAAMLPGLVEFAGILKQQMPGIWPYVNAFPFNAGRAKIGAMSYEDYLRAQVKQIGQPFLSYDQYAVRSDAIGDAFYANLEIARRTRPGTEGPFLELHPRHFTSRVHGSVGSNLERPSLQHARLRRPRDHILYIFSARWNKFRPYRNRRIWQSHADVGKDGYGA